MEMSVVLDGLFLNNDTYNYDDDYQAPDEPEPSHGKVVWLTVLYSLVLLVGLPGNGLLLSALAQRWRSWSASDIFVFQLSLADVLLLATLPLWAAQAALSDGWRLGVTMCRISGAVFNVNFFCGIFTLICLSLFLYLSMVHTKLCSHQNLRTAYMSCILVWIISLLLTVPDWVYLRVRTEKGQTKEDYYSCLPNFHLPEHHLGSRVRYHTVCIVATLLICCLCVLLWLHSAKSAQRRRAVVVVVILVASFLVCWLPFNITLLVDTLRSSSDAGNAASANTFSSLEMPLMITSAFGCAHACLRPLVYFGLCRNFRERTLAVLGCAEGESQGSLWELGVAEEALPGPSQRAEELTQMTSIEHQVQSVTVTKQDQLLNE